MKDKEFTDNEDGIRRIIIKVVYDHTDNVYRPVCVVKGRRNTKKNREYHHLKEVLDMARANGEKWLKTDSTKELKSTTLNPTLSL